MNSGPKRSHTADFETLPQKFQKPAHSSNPQAAQARTWRLRWQRACFIQPCSPSQRYCKRQLWRQRLPSSLASSNSKNYFGLRDLTLKPVYAAARVLGLARSCPWLGMLCGMISFTISLATPGWLTSKFSQGILK